MELYPVRYYVVTTPKGEYRTREEAENGCRPGDVILIGQQLFPTQQDGRPRSIPGSDTPGTMPVQAWPEEGREV